MKIGILIIFQNDELVIDVEKYVELFTKIETLNVCLVNNESTDSTLLLLKEIQEEVNSQISILDVKKNRGTEAAVKAGIRYLTSTKNLSHIIYLEEFFEKDYVALQKVLQTLQQDKNVVKDFFSKLKRLPFKNVFLLESFEVSHVGKETSSLQS